jgi:hypothetical protein
MTALTTDIHPSVDDSAIYAFHDGLGDCDVLRARNCVAVCVRQDGEINIYKIINKKNAKAKSKRNEKRNLFI